MHSHHSHSGEFCAHARSTLAEVVACAAQQGFTHFHLSEHIPRALAEQLYPEEVDAGYTPATLAALFSAYLDEARMLQRAYASAPKPMSVLVGCETENIVSPGSVDFLCETLTRGDVDVPPPYIGIGMVDYLVGSVHHACGVPVDFDAPTFEKALQHCAAHSSMTGHEALLDAYLDAQYEILERVRPEVIGHMDLYRLFAQHADWLPATPTGEALRTKLQRNIRFAASYGALFEANASAFRKGWGDETYPGRQVLRMIRAAHGRLALSDDSHGTDQVGLNYARLHRYLVSEGVDELWYLEQDDSPPFSTDTPSQWAAYTAAERLRTQRAAAPSRDAPRHFPRGARACVDTTWQSNAFWTPRAPLCQQVDL